MKGKEIGNRQDLYKCFDGAISEYSSFNNAHVEHIIIYRDGVGDSMRNQVIGEELKTLKDVLK